METSTEHFWSLRVQIFGSLKSMSQQVTFFLHHGRFRFASAWHCRDCPTSLTALHIYILGFTLVRLKVHSFGPAKFLKSQSVRSGLMCIYSSVIWVLKATFLNPGPTTPLFFYFKLGRPILIVVINLQKILINSNQEREGKFTFSNSCDVLNSNMFQFVAKFGLKHVHLSNTYKYNFTELKGQSFMKNPVTACHQYCCLPFGLSYTAKFKTILRATEMPI